MPNRKRSRDGRHWAIDGVSEQARRAAEDAALQAGAPLEIWLAETVLRASRKAAMRPLRQRPSRTELRAETSNASCASAQKPIRFNTLLRQRVSFLPQRRTPSE